MKVYANIISNCPYARMNGLTCPGHPSIYIAEIGEYHAAESCDPLDKLTTADDTATRPDPLRCEECGRIHRAGGGGRTGFEDCGEDEARHQNDWNY